MKHLEILKKGVNKRKHKTQMNKNELDNLNSRLEKITAWTVSSHTTDRLEQKKIKVSKDDLTSHIKGSDIIEYKIDKMKSRQRFDERVLVTSKKIVWKNNKPYKLNIILSVTTQRIVTVWLNEVGDNHKTLDWNLYTKDMIVPIL